MSETGPEADEADVMEQTTPVEPDEGNGAGDADVPFEADEADVAEQRADARLDDEDSYPG
jgi:hypothetical protein